MLQYIKQNKHVIMVAATLFVISMSTFMFFFGLNGTNPKDFKTDVIEGATESIDVKSLQDEETAYRKLVNNQEDPIFVMNVDGTIKFASWDIENTLGYQQNDLDHQVFFSLLHPDDLSIFLGAFGRVIQDKKPVTMVGPYRLRDKNGEYHLHIGSLFPILSQDTVTQIAISSKDISQKVKDDGQNSDNQNSDTQDGGGKTSVPIQPKSTLKTLKKPETGRFLADQHRQDQEDDQDKNQSEQNLTHGFSTGIDFGSISKIKESKNPDGGGKNMNDCAKV